MEADRVRILDTTLRDGQSSSALLSVSEMITVARQLEKLGVDVIEVGFPGAFDGDGEAVAAIAAAVSEAVVLSLSRAIESDIDQAVRCVAKAKHPGVHVFVAASSTQLVRARQEIVDTACRAVECAKRQLDEVEFTMANALRVNRDALVQIYGEAIRCGATTVNVPDTAGIALPDEFGALIQYLIGHTSGAGTACWSVHCHDDLSLAVANSLAAVRNGARQIECTINGLGPRGGNTAFEAVFKAMTVRAECFQPLWTRIVATEVAPTSRMVGRITHAIQTDPARVSPPTGVDAIGGAPWNQQ
jgi:2-isopropylmalate synthase